MSNTSAPKADGPSLAARVEAHLQSWGMGARVLKTTLAVVLAWELGTHLPGGNDHPYFAPLAALLSFQITVAESVTAVIQRILGIVLGVGVALVVSYALGTTAWGIGLLVFLALVLGANLHLSPQGVSQVAVSALIVTFVGNAGSLSYAGARISESIVGAVVGVLINALLVPPTYLPEARAATDQLGTVVAQVLQTLAAALSTGLSHEQAVAALHEARALHGPLTSARAAVERAATSLKYNPLRRAQRVQLTQAQHNLTTIEHAVLQTRSLARVLADSGGDAPDGALDWTSASRLGNTVGALFAALATVVSQSTAIPDPAATAQMLKFSAACRQAVAEAATAMTPPLTPTAWMHLGALLATTDRMQHDLAHHARPRFVARATVNIRLFTP